MVAYVRITVNRQASDMNWTNHVELWTKSWTKLYYEMQSLDCGSPIHLGQAIAC
jgi:hypothetical protein